MEKQVGQTKNAGFQFGIRRTFPVSADSAWAFLFSREGLRIWLGTLSTELELKQHFQTTAGVTGFVRVWKPGSHIRLNWKRPEWPNTSTVQLRIIDKGPKTTIAIHQEHLLDANQRAVLQPHWQAVMKVLATRWS